MEATRGQFFINIDFLAKQKTSQVCLQHSLQYWEMFRKRNSLMFRFKLGYLISFKCKKIVSKLQELDAALWTRLACSKEWCKDSKGGTVEQFKWQKVPGISDNVLNLTQFFNSWNVWCSSIQTSTKIRILPSHQGNYPNYSRQKWKSFLSQDPYYSNKFAFWIQVTWIFSEMANLSAGLKLNSLFFSLWPILYCFF